MPRSMNVLTRCLAIFAALVVVLFAAPRAQAQFGFPGADGMGEQGLTKRGVDAYIKILALDKDQREAVMTLLEGNQTEYKAAQEKMQAAMKAIQEKVADTQDFTLYQKEMPKVGIAFSEKAKGLEKSFFDDLKLSLNEAQLANFPRVERYRRRETGLRFAFVTGATVDLIQVMDRLKPTAASAAEFGATLDQYEIEMDKHLVALEKAGKEAQDNMGKGDANMFDPAKIESMMKGFYTVGKEMRDTNHDYARKLSQLMDEPSKAKFDAEVRKRTFPRIYKDPPVLKMIQTATVLPDLDAVQKESLATLKSGYDRDAASMNDKWAKAVEDREEKAGGTIMVMMKSMQSGPEFNKDVNDARQARKELEERTKERLKTILKPDQLAKVPEPPAEQRGNPWADFMPSNDDEESK